MSSAPERGGRDPVRLKAGVIGWPVAHSLSPVLHGYWLKAHGIDGRYDRLAIPPEGLENFLKSLNNQGWRGVNITIPHKEAAYRLVDETTGFADRVRAVNTVVVAAGGRLRGDNTDGFGFIEALKSAAPDFDFAAAPAVVLGAGGASRAIIAALQDAGVPELRLANRTRSRAEEMIAQIGGEARIIDWPARQSDLIDAGLVVNTTALGLKGTPAPALTEMAATMPAAAVASDIVYSPVETAFLKAAAARGCRTVDGLGMLMHQARPGFEAWFGARPAVTPGLKSALLAAVEG